VLGGLALLVVALLGAVFMLRTPDGTLIVEVSEPDAAVQILDRQGRVEVTRQSGQDRLLIEVDPGKHRLKVEKNGFRIYTREFMIEEGGTQRIAARLEPVQGPKVLPPASQRISASGLDKAAAQWVLEIGGELVVSVDGLDRIVRQPEDVPREAFRITEINLHDNVRVGDAVLERIKGLANLASLNLSYTPVGDAGLKHVAQLVGLQQLFLESTRVTDAGIQ
jgi:hypothetical protein